MSRLAAIQSPQDVKALDTAGLKELAEEIREAIIDVTAANGGHIGPNLGVVELTIALHRVFDTPKDKFTFDVAHQGYVHKLLTGRQGEAFQKIRQAGGLSGFLTREESEHDHFGAGHAGTALSAALGMASARDLKGTDEHVVAVVGDAAFTCGITMEALNNITSHTKRLIVILNDNEWSISKNVGALSHYLNELITHPAYNRVDSDVRGFLAKVPGGESILKFGSKWKQETKDFFVSSSLFESYGLRYVGPIDGHDLDALHRFLEFAKKQDTPILLHVRTEKGRGYPIAVENPEKFHGCSPFDRATGDSLPSAGPKLPKYQDVFGKTLLKFAEADPKVVGITAAMPPGTGLSFLREERPSQFFDVGIAEEHAVLFAAGLATQGIKPFVAIYSTFLQRAVDPIIHDICLQNLPVVFCMDRAGLSPNDGPTHHGLFDLAYLRSVPNVVLLQPKDEAELVDMMQTALKHDGPIFIRYPRGSGEGVAVPETGSILEIGRSELVREGADLAIWALGPWVADAVAMADNLEATEGISVAVVNGRFAQPVDAERLRQHARQFPLLVSMEDHQVRGGFGSALLEVLGDQDDPPPLLRIGWPDAFVEHGNSVRQLRATAGLDPETIRLAIVERYRSVKPITVTAAK